MQVGDRYPEKYAWYKFSSRLTFWLSLRSIHFFPTNQLDTWHIQRRLSRAILNLMRMPPHHHLRAQLTCVCHRGAPSWCYVPYFRHSLYLQFRYAPKRGDNTSKRVILKNNQRTKCYYFELRLVEKTHLLVKILLLMETRCDLKGNYIFCSKLSVLFYPKSIESLCCTGTPRLAAFCCE